MHCTVNNDRRHCCRLLKEKAASPNSARRARSDICIRQCGPSTTARLWLQHQLTGNSPSLVLQLHAEQTSQSSFSAKRITKQKGENRPGTRVILSPAKFNYYLAEFPTPPPNIKLIKYADDITIYTSGPVVADLINGLKVYLSQVLNYIKRTDSVNGQINSNTFHARYPRAPLTSTSEVGRPRTVARQEAKCLGETFDTHLTFTQHCNNIAVKVHQRNNVLKVLAGSPWGCDKETLLTTYQAIGRSIHSYCCPV